MMHRHSAFRYLLGEESEEFSEEDLQNVGTCCSEGTSQLFALGAGGLRALKTQPDLCDSSKLRM